MFGSEKKDEISSARGHSRKEYNLQKFQKKVIKKCTCVSHARKNYETGEKLLFIKSPAEIICKSGRISPQSEKSHDAGRRNIIGVTETRDKTSKTDRDHELKVIKVCKILSVDGKVDVVDKESNNDSMDRLSRMVAFSFHKPSKKEKRTVEVDTGVEENVFTSHVGE